MPGFRWISFTTDYGLVDGFVAACHGVLARLAPHARVIDVTHQVPPGDIRHGAALLAATLPHLPAAVHIAVVDPGVGTPRRAVAVQTAGGVLVGPDNGLLPWAADALGGVEVAVALTDPRWFAPVVSRTFHGRDIFAPVAARLSSGATVADAGPALDPADLIRLPKPVVRGGEDWLEAEVLTVDRFGNLQLAAPGGQLARLPARLRVHGAPAVRGETFADAAPGELVVLVDSAGYVAVATNGGSAAQRLGVAPGELVRVDPYQ
jgi:S-adenosylmethionine hydrolase